MLNKFAEDLKNAREKMGITLLDIASETKLHPSIFEKIEDGDFNFQPQTYIKAFLKQYAKYLRLDPIQVLRDYDLAKANKYVSKTAEKPKEVKKIDIPPPPPVEEIIPEPIEEFIEVKTEETLAEVFEAPEEKQVYTGPKKILIEKESFIEPPKEKKPLFDVRAIGTNTQYLKYVGIAAIAIVVLIGLIFVVKAFFSGPSDTKDKIVRQTNFDSTSKEYEKNLMGTTEQEKIDSIKRAKDQIANNEQGDYKLVLKLEGRDKGTVKVYEDEKGEKDVKKSEFKKGDILTFKAKEQFKVSSGNTNSFRITVNDKQVKFRKKDVQKVKIYLEKDGKPKTDEK